MCYWKLNYQNVSNQIAQFLHPIVSLDSSTKINYQAMGQVYQMLCWLQSRYICFSTISADSATTPQLLVSFRVTLAWTCLLLDWVKCSCVSCTLLSKAAVGQLICPQRVTGEWELPDSSEMKDGADAWRGIIIAGTGRLPMGFLAESLLLALYGTISGWAAFFLARHCYHLLPKHHLARVPRAPWEGQNLRTNTKLVSSRLPATN